MSHPCPECAQWCFCDGEDAEGDEPEDGCIHECDFDDIEDEVRSGGDEHGDP